MLYSLQLFPIRATRQIQFNSMVEQMWKRFEWYEVGTSFGQIMNEKDVFIANWAPRRTRNEESAIIHSSYKLECVWLHSGCCDSEWWNEAYSAWALKSVKRFVGNRSLLSFCLHNNGRYDRAGSRWTWLLYTFVRPLSAHPSCHHMWTYIFHINQHFSLLPH